MRDAGHAPHIPTLLAFVVVHRLAKRRRILQPDPGALMALRAHGPLESGAARHASESASGRLLVRCGAPDVTAGAANQPHDHAAEFLLLPHRLRLADRAGWWTIHGGPRGAPLGPPAWRAAQ